MPNLLRIDQNGAQNYAPLIAFWTRLTCTRSCGSANRFLFYISL